MTTGNIICIVGPSCAWQDGKRGAVREWKACVAKTSVVEQYPEIPRHVLIECVRYIDGEIPISALSEEALVD